ncbi:ABC transporter ATP-binding protein [Bacillus sp. JJ722]|uniref:ABC transporter ATP-binding protein n=1 Tax=Bacillus sp. JJ722 TaxID=3122973 RepID=UPI002FFEC076
MKHLLYFIKQIHNYSGKILYINLICMMFIGFFESVGIFLLIPLIDLTGMFDLNTVDIPVLNGINNLFVGIPKEIQLVMILGVYVILIGGQSIFQRNQTILSVKIQQNFIVRLREDTYKGLLQANWAFFLKKRKSDIINIMANETFNVSDGLYLFFRFVSNLIFTFIQISIAFYLSAKMTIFIIAFGLILIMLSKKFTKKSSALGEETFQLSKTYMAGITDHFNGIKDIKSNSLEAAHMDWFISLSKKMKENNINLTMVNTTSQVIFKIVSGLLIATFAYFSIQMFMAQPAQLVVITVIFARLWPRFAVIQSNLEQLGYCIPSFKALEELQKECLNAQEVSALDHKDIIPITMEQGLTSRNVYFKYNPNENIYTLKNINIKIPSYRMTAIVGKSGAGKSTLIDLLMGLNKPDKGEVIIDNLPLTNEKLLSFRKSISYIPQDPFLFNGTIRENLILVDYHASIEDIWKALEFAAAADFVRKLPQGLDTLIGDRGIKLSGGERQRLVLARAILRKPSILVLDEATSALDTESEAKIQRAIERLKGSMTIIVIAHRLSTIRNADQVLVMDKGSIIQIGEYNKLAKDKRGMFSSLLSNQLESSV